MEVLENLALNRIILDHLADLYKIGERRKGLHLSSLVYCLTKGFFDSQAPAQITDEEVMLFALGLGLQDVLTPADAETPCYELDGITFSPDFLLRDFQPQTGSYQLVELKTTRMATGKAFPDTWLEYIKGGCYIRGVNTYQLSVLHMLGSYRPPFPEIKSYTLIFSDEELQCNWSYLKARQIAYCTALENNKPPTPRLWCKDWECKYCRYRLQCDALIILKERRKKEEQ